MLLVQRGDQGEVTGVGTGPERVGGRTEIGSAGRGGAGAGGCGTGAGGTGAGGLAGREAGGVVSGARVATVRPGPGRGLERAVGLCFADPGVLVVVLAPPFSGAECAAGRSEAGKALTPWRYASAMAVTVRT